jgi:hypothetical protein
MKEKQRKKQFSLISLIISATLPAKFCKYVWLARRCWSNKKCRVRNIYIHGIWKNRAGVIALVSSIFEQAGNWRVTNEGTTTLEVRTVARGWMFWTRAGCRTACRFSVCMRKWLWLFVGKEKGSRLSNRCHKFTMLKIGKSTLLRLLNVVNSKSQTPLVLFVPFC